MKCDRCDGRMFVDRVFSENKNYEIFCIICGDRKFIHKESRLGQWLAKHETARENAVVRS